MWREKSENDNRDPNGKPPFLGTWRAVYAVVLGTLGLLIVIFYLFTEMYR